MQKIFVSGFHSHSKDEVINTIIHKTKEAAQDQARRMAAKHDLPWGVFELVSAYEPETPPVRTIEII